jgi:hypothetical protein
MRWGLGFRRCMVDDAEDESAEKSSQVAVEKIDAVLQANDILMVRGSAGKRAPRRVAEAMLQVGFYGLVYTVRP